MKRYIQSSVILLAALALAGCAKTEEFQCNPDSVLQIESVSGISPFSLMQEPASKAVITGESLPSDEAAKGIGLFVTASNGGAYDGKTEGYSNVKFTYNSAKWSAASPVYLTNTTGKLYGYFPYNADATDLTAVPVQSSLNGTDYLYATAQEVSFSNKSVNLQMNHALARLHLTIRKGDKYPSDYNLSKIVIQSKAIDATGTLDITTGTVTPAKAADATGTFELTDTDVITTAGIEKDILLIPADNTEGKKDLTLILTIDGAEAKVNFTGGNGLDIRAGIQCNVSLNIKDNKLEVISVGVEGWDNKVSGNIATVDGHTVTFNFDNASRLNPIITVEKLSSAFNEEIPDGIISAIAVFTYDPAAITEEKFVSCTSDVGCNCVLDKKDHTITVSEVTQDVTVNVTVRNCTRIFYTATAKVEPHDKTAMGVPFDNERSSFSNGSGVMYFEGTVTTIGANAFQNCNALESITLPEGLTAIDYEAFKSCNKLTGLQLPSTLETIGNSAFYEAGKDASSGSISLNLPASLKSIGESAFEKSKVTSVSGGSGALTSIGKYAFRTSKLVNADLSSTALTKLLDEVFRDCYELEQISLPSSLNQICSYAIAWCFKLKTVTIEADTAPSCADYALHETSKKIQNIYVPAASVDAYKAADGWKELSDKISAIPSQN